MPVQKNNSADVKGSKMGKFVKSFSVVAAVTLGMVVSTPNVKAELPSFKVENASLISSSAADGFYSNAANDPIPSGASITDLWTNGRPEAIKQLARALGKGRLSDQDYLDTVYEYIHNNINITPMFGLQKGSVGTLIDLHGTAFDQANLMVELLREAGIAANYVVGTVTVTKSAVANWIGIADASGSFNESTLQKVLADGGIPASFDGSDVKLTHIWVDALSKKYDPSFKTHNIKDSITLSTAMGYSQSTFLSSAKTGASYPTGSNYIKSINDANIVTKLKYYAGKLETYIRNNLPTGRIEDVIGGREVDMSSMTAPSASHPHSAVDIQSWSGEIPDIYRTILRVQYGNADIYLYADQVYGQKFHVDTNYVLVDGTTVNMILLNESEIITAYDGSLASSPSSISITVDHPYAADNGDYLDRTISKSYLYSYQSGSGPAPFNIVTGFGYSSEKIISVHRNLASKEAKGWSTYFYSSRRSAVVYNWLASFSRLAEVNDGIANGIHQHHHSIGILFPAAGSSVDIDTAVSLNSLSDSSNTKTAMGYHLAMGAAELEGWVAAAMKGSYEEMSAPYLFRRGNHVRQTKFFDVLGTTQWNSTRGSLNGYTSTFEALVGSYVSAGYRVIIPEHAKLYDDTNYGSEPYTPTFFAIKPDGSSFAEIFSDLGLKGGGVFSTDGPEHNPDALIHPRFRKNNYKISSASGSLSYEWTGLTVGSGSFPYSLPYTFTNDTSSGYNDSASWANLNPDTKFADMSYGWKNMYDLQSSIISDAFVGMGSDNPLAAVNLISSLYVALDLLKGNSSLDRVLISQIVNSRGIFHFHNNTIKVETFEGSETFYRLGDFVEGRYAASLSSTSKLELLQPTTSVPYYRFTNGEGVEYLFLSYNLSAVNSLCSGSGSTGGAWFGSYASDPRSGKIHKVTWPSGMELDFDYGENITETEQCRLKTVTNSLGRKLDFWSETSTDGNNRAIAKSCEYEGSTLYPAQYGPFRVKSCTYKDADGKGTKFEYDNFQIKKIFLPSDHTNAQATFDYDEFDRIKEVRTITTKTPYTTASTEYRIAGVGGSRRTEIVDALGNSTISYFNRYGAAIRQLDQIARTVIKEYDGIGRLSKASLPEGNSVSYEYDSRHNVIEERLTAKLGSGNSDIVKSAVYPAVCINSKICNKPISTTDARGNKTYYAFDSITGNLQRLIKEVSSGQCSSNTTNSDDNCYVTSFTYNSYGQVTSVADPENMKRSYTYKPVTSHSVLSSNTMDSGVGGKNLTATYTFDAVGNVTGIFDPRGNVTSITYDTMRRPETSTTPDPDGSGPLKALVTVNKYDDDGLLWRVSRREGTDTGVLSSRKETKYTDAGQVEETYNPECFDAAGVRNVMLPGCNVTTNYYDTVGRAKVVKDGEGRKTKTIFYDDGSVHKIIRAWQGNPLNTAEVANDNDPCTIANTNQQCYATYTYWPTGKTVADAKDYNGPQKSVMDANGNLTNYFHDGFDRLDKFQLPHDTNIGQSNPADYEQYTYDTNGNMTQKRKRDGKTITMIYDAQNRVTSKMPQGQTAVSYTYDKVGRQTEVKFSTNDHPVSHVYDTAGRLKSTTDDGRLIEYDYDAAGNRTKVDYPNVTGETTDFWVQYVYDDLNRVTEINQNGTTNIATYAYDPSGRRDSISLGNGAEISYDYHDDDALEQLIHDFDGVAGLTGDDVRWNYGFNAVNQLTSKTISNTAYQWLPLYAKNNSYVSNGLNQYAGIANNNMQYDLNGNLTSDGVWIYTYDTENMLATASRPDVSASYIYDPMGRRSTKVTGGTTTTYLHDGVEEIADYTVNGSTATLDRRYVHGPGVDEYLVMYTGAGTGNKQFYHANHQGSIVAMSDGSGTVLDQYSYDSYGNSDDLTGNPFRYTGRRLDAETGLYYYRARYYSPAIGRFLQTDPIGYGDGLNWYAYVGNDPLNGNDPSGKARIATLSCRPTPGGVACKTIITNIDIKALSNFATKLTGLFLTTHGLLNGLDTFNNNDASDSSNPGVKPTEDDEADEIFDSGADPDEMPANEEEAQAIRDAVRGDTGNPEIEAEDIGDQSHQGEDKMRSDNGKYRIHYWRDRATGATYGGKIKRRY